MFRHQNAIFWESTNTKEHRYLSPTLSLWRYSNIKILEHTRFDKYKSNTPWHLSYTTDSLFQYSRSCLYFVCSVYKNISHDICNPEGSRQTGRGMLCTPVPKHVVWYREMYFAFHYVYFTGFYFVHLLTITLNKGICTTWDNKIHMLYDLYVA